MNVLSERRRSPPTLHAIPARYRADRQAVHGLRARCAQAGIKMTDLRDVLLHGLLRAGDEASAIEIWKTITEMTGGNAPSCGSLQRNLNIMTDRGVLVRKGGLDRVWRYSIASDTRGMADDEPPLVMFLEAGTGRKTRCDLPEVAAFLRQLSMERGLTIRSAAITLLPSGEQCA
ncbi:Fur family transcriptional regulator [Gluconacetobacter takamatsuzukensis]|uniref:Fur family transcriptional regulator n=1 Tax=Gluconacetobacter takamatsuzukensis TaxID=1286190 RepID=A0A7W4KFA0_9PROT|nr:Fur family transcriptional regulator [Gluconacetobacter takamatsuzukensis]MBB2205833.1 Fur family transcriptional regulator [Gluconacetobacter takamatsuzukensis]